MENLKEGQIIEGKVKQVFDFGAIVELEPGDGFLHVSEINSMEALKIGDIVKVRILKIDSVGKINLSMKQVDADEFKKSENAAEIRKNHKISPSETNVKKSKRFSDYIAEKEYEKYNLKKSSHSFLELPLMFDDPEKLHEDITRSFSNLEKDWYGEFPQFKAIAFYATVSDEDEKISNEANPSSLEEFFVVNAADEKCPVYLWTHETPFGNLDFVSESLNIFLKSLQE